MFEDYNNEKCRIFFKNYFKACTQSLKKEGALENHASLFETHSNIKMQWFFFLGENSYYFYRIHQNSKSNVNMVILKSA